MTTSDLPPTARIRRRILTFRGTPNELLTYLRTEAFSDDLAAAYRDEYDWELTCSVARHPAGKGLGR